MVAIPEYDLKNVVTGHRVLGLWRMMSGFRLSYLAATLSLAVAAASKAANYMLLRYLVDGVLALGRSGSALGGVALAFVGLALVEGGFSFLSGRLAAQTAEGITLRLRNYLFDHIQRLSFTYHDHTPTGELIERSTSDVDAVRRLYADQAIGVGRIVALFAINLAALLRLNVRLAVLAVAVVPLIVVMSILFFGQVSKAYEEYQEQGARVSTVLQENLTGMRVVRAFARQSFERDKFKRENWLKFQRGRHLLTMHSLYWPLSDILCGAQMLLSVTVGANMVIGGSISLGTYLAYVGLIIWVIWPMRNLGRLIVQFSSGLVSLDRVAEVIREDQEPLTEGEHRPVDGLRGEVVFNNVGFQYQSGYQALADVTFHCEPGQMVALLGSTGSGKTTLVSLLPRFFEYTGGSILLDGVELKAYPRQYLRQQIGIVEQEPFLFSRTVRENMTYGVRRAVTDAAIESAARAAGIHEDIVMFPKGYETLVGEKGVMLSGGQKQRVAIARTLLRDPRILILDDSTSSVDTETEHLIRAALERLMLGRTTFVIAHRIQSLMSADLILVFDRGRIVQRGRHDDLTAEPGMYRQIYDLQARMEVELTAELEPME